MTGAIARPGGATGAAIGLVERAAQATGARAFLVGGPVRDLLLGAPARDLDVAVEGDAEALAREIARLAGSAHRVPGPFLTFKVPLPDGGELDVATARKERYPHPGALPVVEPATIAEDLLRRDFSINAIALDLDGWSLVDPAGGVSDLRAGLLRVLHGGSFVDDPTRILRGLRFKARLGFTFEPVTRQRLDDAIAAGVLSSVSRERIWRELIHACNEPPGREPALLAIAASGALERTLGVGRAPVAAEALARFERDPGSLTSTGADATLVKLALLFGGSGVDERALTGAPMRERSRRLLLAIARDPRRGAAALTAIGDAGAVWDAIEAMAPEERTVAGLFDDSARSSIERFEQVAASPVVPGAAGLGVPPGPWIGAALRATCRALFARAISEGEAPAFARRAALDYLRRQDRKE